MSILIKNMEMPTSCERCPMLDWDLDYVKCKVTDRHFNVVTECWRAIRVPDCPLIPVPPHGDLIDASTKVTVQTYDDMYEEYRDEECTIAEALDRWSNEGCPEAIIPAEEGKA